MKRLFVAVLASTFALLGAAVLRAQRAAVPSCDADSGGLKLPAGFCALVIADNLGEARNLVVAPNGDIFVSLRTGPRAEGQPPQPGYILGMRDTNGDGKIDVKEKFGTNGATGIRLRFNERLYIDLALAWPIAATYDEQPLPNLCAIYRQYFLVQSGPSIESVAV